jgi:hypothetical protein
MIDPESSPFIDRKLGNFSVPLEWLESIMNRDAEEIFKNFRIIRAEIDYASNAVLYVAASELFDRVPENTMAPSYRIMVDRATPESPITIRVSKV